MGWGGVGWGGVRPLRSLAKAAPVPTPPPESEVEAWGTPPLNGGFAFNMSTLIKSHENNKNNNHSFNSFLKDKTILHKNLENGMSFISDKSLDDEIENSRALAI